ncbi:predicted protein [Botrytis cinerea T4]|uniref:Uncharacterized protein n=1 Tax=Botryotinia fuckeliana (strain T4) TaxID=999810 RepID=G2YCU3_BOTF4|nr:predicted protein [Botrytis cinerea T4]
MSQLDQAFDMYHGQGAVPSVNHVKHEASWPISYDLWPRSRLQSYMKYTAKIRSLPNTKDAETRLRYTMY